MFNPFAKPTAEQVFMREIRKEYYKQKAKQKVNYYKAYPLALAVDVLLVATTIILLDDVNEIVDEYIDQGA